jgi:hypothetical protein
VDRRIPDAREEAEKMADAIFVSAPGELNMREFVISSIRDIQYRTIAAVAADIRGNFPCASPWVIYLRVSEVALSVKEGK